MIEVSENFQTTIALMKIENDLCGKLLKEHYKNLLSHLHISELKEYVLKHADKLSEIESFKDLQMLLSENSNAQISRYLNAMVAIEAENQYENYTTNLKNMKSDILNILKDACSEIIKNQIEKQKMEAKDLSKPIQIDDKDKNIIAITGSNMRLSQLADKIQQFKDANEIRIIAGRTLELDCNLNIPGKNLMIFASNIQVTKPVIFNTSGKNAKLSDVDIKHGISKRKTVQPCGEAGDDGCCGSAGESAGNIHIKAKNYVNLDDLSINANGGNGAAGSNGGDGDDGADGFNGRDGNKIKKKDVRYGEALINKGEAGKCGKNGGKGGDAGLGGEGGYPGEIIIEDENNKNIFVKNIEANQGNTGENGKPGKGGLGGKHGVNGTDYGFAHNRVISNHKLRGKPNETIIAVKEKGLFTTHHLHIEKIRDDSKREGSRAERGKDGERFAQKRHLAARKKLIGQHISDELFAKYQLTESQSKDNSAEVHNIEHELTHYINSKIQQVTSHTKAVAKTELLREDSSLTTKSTNKCLEAKPKEKQLNQFKKDRVLPITQLERYKTNILIKYNNLDAEVRKSIAESLEKIELFFNYIEQKIGRIQAIENSYRMIEKICDENLAKQNNALLIKQLDNYIKDIQLQSIIKDNLTPKELDDLFSLILPEDAKKQPLCLLYSFGKRDFKLSELVNILNILNSLMKNDKLKTDKYSLSLIEELWKVAIEKIVMLHVECLNKQAFFGLNKQDINVPDLSKPSAKLLDDIATMMMNSSLLNKNVIVLILSKINETFCNNNISKVIDKISSIIKIKKNTKNNNEVIINRCLPAISMLIKNISGIDNKMSFVLKEKFYLELLESLSAQNIDEQQLFEVLSNVLRIINNSSTANEHLRCSFDNITKVINQIDDYKLKMDQIHQAFYECINKFLNELIDISHKTTVVNSEGVIAVIRANLLKIGINILSEKQNDVDKIKALDSMLQIIIKNERGNLTLISEKICSICQQTFRLSLKPNLTEDELLSSLNMLENHINNFNDKVMIIKKYVLEQLINCAEININHNIIMNRIISNISKYFTMSTFDEIKAKIDEDIYSEVISEVMHYVPSNTKSIKDLAENFTKLKALHEVFVNTKGFSKNIAHMKDKICVLINNTYMEILRKHLSLLNHENKITFNSIWDNFSQFTDKCADNVEMVKNKISFLNILTKTLNNDPDIIFNGNLVEYFIQIFAKKLITASLDYSEFSSLLQCATLILTHAELSQIEINKFTSSITIAYNKAESLRHLDSNMACDENFKIIEDELQQLRMLIKNHYYKNNMKNLSENERSTAKLLIESNLDNNCRKDIDKYKEYVNITSFSDSSISNRIIQSMLTHSCHGQKGLLTTAETILSKNQHRLLNLICESRLSKSKVDELGQIFTVTMPDNWDFFLEEFAADLFHESILKISGLNIEVLTNLVISLKLESSEKQSLLHDVKYMLNTTEHDHARIKNLINKINKFIETHQKNNEYCNVLRKFQYSVDMLNKFKYQFNRSRFFAQQNDKVIEWVNLLNTIILKSNNSAHISNDLHGEASIISDILIEASETDCLEHINSIVSRANPKHWLSAIYNFKYSILLKEFVNNAVNYQQSDKLNRSLKLEHFSALQDKTSIVKILCNKLKQENLLISQASKLTPSELHEILIQLNSLTLCNENIDKLEKTPFSQWKALLRKIRLSNNLLQSDTSSHSLREQCVSLLQQIEQHCDSCIVDKLILSINNSNKIEKINLESLVKLLDKIFRHELQINESILNKLNNKPISIWELELKKCQNVLSNCELSLDEILKNLKESISIDTSKLNNLSNNSAQSFKEKIAAIKETMKLAAKYSMIDNNKMQKLEIFTKPIKDWSLENIKEWINHHKRSKGDLDVYTSIAIVCRAVQLIFKYIPRDTQLLGVLMLLESPDNLSGRFGEMATGEGKTLMTAMFAIIKTLMGEKVGVITSNNVLAIRDSTKSDIPKLYEAFDLTVKNNCDEACENDIEIRKQRYKADIVYGDIGSFQRDTLLSHFEGLDVLGGKQFTALMVDEVDSMLLDKSENVLYLSHEISDLRYLRNIYIEIWQFVNAKDNIQCKSNEYDFYIEEILPILKARLDKGEIQSPNHLRHFIDYRLAQWIKNAFIARDMSLDDSYTLMKNNKQDKKITIVDKDTGVEQTQMQWSNGLHQFLQLKHAKELSTESLKAIFMSNMAYLKGSYLDDKEHGKNSLKPKLYGLTGTLGSDADRELLSKVYGADFFQLPRYASNRFYEELGEVVETEEEWLKSIEAEVKKKIEQNRPVLLICENIEKVKRLYERLQNLTKEGCEVNKYTKAYKEFPIGSKTDNAVKPKQIIIATNLAGRGTDLIISPDAKKNGGLFVGLTYMPGNVRIEKQAFGRAARQGDPGSGKFLVMNKEKLSLTELRKRRDEVEQLRIEEVRTHSVQKLEVEGKLLQKFGRLKNEIRARLTQGGIFNKGYIDIQLKNLNDHWAFWLDEMGERLKLTSKLGEPAIMEDFQTFVEKMQKISKQPDIFKYANSMHELLKLGAFFLKKEKYTYAEECFDKIINEHKQYAEMAHQFKVFCILKQKTFSGINLKKVIKSHLKKSQALILGKIDKLCASNEALKIVNNCRQILGYGQYPNQYAKQIENECNLLGVHLNAISDAIGAEISPATFENIADKKIDMTSEAIFNLLRGPHMQTKASTRSKSFFDFLIHDKSINDKRPILKDYRISKKVLFCQNDKSLYVKFDEGQQKVIIPSDFAYCEKEIINTINDIVNKRSADFKDRIIKDDIFSKDLVDKFSFWQLLKDNNILLDERGFKIIKLNKNKFSELNLTGLDDADNTLKNMLLLNDGKKFEKSLFNDLSQEQFAKLEDKLQEHKLILVTKSAKLTMPYENNKIKLPSGLVKYKDILSSMLENTNNAQKMNIENNITLDSVPLADSVKEAGIQLRNSLQHQGVIKACEVNFSLASEISKDDIKKRLDSILDTIEQEIKAQNSEVSKKDVEQIFNLFKQSIGKIKQFPELKISLTQLEKYFENGEFPPEIYEYQKLIFDQILCFEEKINRWDWRAFAVAMLGLAQIIAGIALEVFTYGAATPIATMLISEGISDMLFAVQSGLTGTFTWRNYAIHKATSLAISVCTFGICAGISTGVLAAKEATTLLKLFGKTAIRVTTDAAKQIGFTIAGVVLDKVFSGVPKLIIEKFGESIQEKLSQSDRVKRSAEQLNKTIEQLFASVGNNEIALNYLKTANEKMHAAPDAAWYGGILEVCQREVPNMVLLVAQEIGKANNFSKAVLIAEIGREIVNLVSAGTKCAELIGMVPKRLDALNNELQLQLKIIQAQNQLNGISQRALNEKDHQEIKQFIESQKSELTRSMIHQISDDVAKPLALRATQRAMSVLCTVANKAITNQYLSAVNKGNNQSQALKGITETQIQNNQIKDFAINKPLVDNNNDNSSNNSDIVDAKNLSPRTPVANLKNMTVEQVMQSKDYRHVKFYKDNNGRVFADNQSVYKLIHRGNICYHKITLPNRHTANQAFRNTAFAMNISRSAMNITSVLLTTTVKHQGDYLKYCKETIELKLLEKKIKEQEKLKLLRQKINDIDSEIENVQKEQLPQPQEIMMKSMLNDLRSQLDINGHKIRDTLVHEFENIHDYSNIHELIKQLDYYKKVIQVIYVCGFVDDKKLVTRFIARVNEIKKILLTNKLVTKNNDDMSQLDALTQGLDNFDNLDVDLNIILQLLQASQIDDFELPNSLTAEIETPDQFIAVAQENTPHNFSSNHDLNSSKLLQNPGLSIFSCRNRAKIGVKVDDNAKNISHQISGLAA